MKPERGWSPRPWQAVVGVKGVSEVSGADQYGKLKVSQQLQCSAVY